VVESDVHHRRSIRLKGFDYALEGLYFVTICTQGHVPLFGEIVAGQVRLNDAGHMVQTVWESMPVRFPTTALDAYVIMPDHFHALIAITNSAVGAGLVPALPLPTGTPGGHPQGVPLQPEARRPALGNVVGAFKSLTTRAYIAGVRDAGWPAFDRRIWQRNYWEHVVRNETEHERTVSYILDNPSRWRPDEHTDDAWPDFPNAYDSP